MWKFLRHDFQITSIIHFQDEYIARVVSQHVKAVDDLKTVCHVQWQGVFQKQFNRVEGVGEHGLLERFVQTLVNLGRWRY